MAGRRRYPPSGWHALQLDHTPVCNQPGIATALAELARTEHLSPQPPTRSSIYSGEGAELQRLHSICQPGVVNIACNLLQLYQLHHLHSVEPVWQLAQELRAHHALLQIGSGIGRAHV